jgi:hypothetical protein
VLGGGGVAWLVLGALPRGVAYTVLLKPHQKNPITSNASAILRYSFIVSPILEV